MNVRPHKRFEKQFERLSPKNQLKVIATIETFKANPFNSRLRNHALKGPLEGSRAISVMSNLRIVYKEERKGFALLTDVGTHNQVY